MIRRQGARWAGLLFATSALSLALGAPALAQAPARAQAEEPTLEDEGYEVDELVVTAARQVAPRGSVVGEAQPEITLDQREIRALGVSSVNELLAALEPQLASGRGRGGGRPIMLVNGQRISSFREIRDLPPEAIVRMEILPEEVALRYGYRADQRVVNFVLRRRFRAVTVEAGVTAPTADDAFTEGATYDATLDGLLIDNDARQQVNLKAGLQTPLLESQRNVIRTPDETAFRTLIGRRESLSLNAIYARPLKEGVSATLNGSLEWTDSTGRLGLDPGDLDALRRLTDTNTAHLGGAVNGAVSGWRWSLTGNADWTESHTTTEVAFDPGIGGYRPPNSSRSTVTSADVQGLVNGTLFDLPAGGVNAAFTVGAATTQVEGRAFRRGVTQETDLDRQTVNAQVNFDAPIASRTRGGIEGIGNLSVNFNANVEHYSDFGTLWTLGAGVTWSPIEAVRLIASVTDEDGAPTIQQLGDPILETHKVSVFDFVTGETVEVVQFSGGNPELLADNRRVMKLGLTLKPWEDTDFTIRADYTRTRTEDEIASFPAITAEAARLFPGRITRNDANELVSVDVRPVNFARHDEQQLRWGFNYSRPLRNTRPPPFAPQRPQGAAPPEGGPPAEGPPTNPSGGESARGPRGDGAGFGGPGGGRGGGGFGGRRGGFGGGNVQFAVFHTWRIEDEVLIGPGEPVLDLLDGAALSQGGGSPRHQIDVQAGVSRNGLGARLNARWQEGTTVEGGAAGERLRFSDLTTVDLRLFADLGMQPMARNNPWMRGARVTLAVDNVFDEVRAVRDEAGLVPLNYQPDLVDPLGRTVRVSFRKLFLPRRAVPPPGQTRERRPGA